MNDKNPTMVITEQGVSICKDVFKKMGEIAWSDIGVVDRKRSMIVFSSLYRDVYIIRLSQKEQKAYYSQARKLDETSLAWIEETNVDYPWEDFLKLTESLIDKNRKGGEK